MKDEFDDEFDFEPAFESCFQSEFSCSNGNEDDDDSFYVQPTHDDDDLFLLQNGSEKNMVPNGRDAETKYESCSSKIVSRCRSNSNWVICPYCADKYPVPPHGALTITCLKCRLKYSVRN